MARRTLAAAGLALLLAGLAPAAARAGIVSPVQSTATPLGLSPVAPVMLAGSDERAATFQADALPLVIETAVRELGEQQAVTDLDVLRLDAGRLVMPYAVDPRVYFVGEGAGYRNSLLAQVTTAGGTTLDPMLVLPNASSTVPFGIPDDPRRTGSAPLSAGDFVDLPTVTAGDRLDFHLVPNGANGSQDHLFSTDASLNTDGLEQHTVSLVLSALKDSPYLLIGFEDLPGGGDLDYNDLVFALDVGEANVAHLVATQAPVPGPLAAFAAAGFLALRRWLRRRRAARP